MNKIFGLISLGIIVFIGSCGKLSTETSANPVITTTPDTASNNPVVAGKDSISYFLGPVGIGTTNPKVGYKLDVEGGIYSSGGLTCAGNIDAPVISAQNNILSYGGISAMGTINTNGDGYFGGKVQAKSYIFPDSTGQAVDLVALVKELPAQIQAQQVQIQALQAQVKELQAQLAQTHTLKQ